MNRIILLYTFVFALPSISMAQVVLPHFFCNHMVVQREQAAEIWGRAEAGAKVTVAFKGNTAMSKADEDGHWRVGIETGVADARGADLEISSGGVTSKIRDVVVGEVWLASGQSNMVFTMNRVPAYEDIIAESDYPQIRMFNAPTVTATEPQEDIDGEWTLCSPDTVPGYSAVAFFFARKLHQELGIPIGVIKTAWGGKPVETFTSREALSNLPATKTLVDAIMTADASYDSAKAKIAFQAKMDQWEKAREVWKTKPTDQRGRLARRPSSPKRPLNTEGKPGVLFDSMIHPFIGYTMRGAIWYQGEANAKPGAVPYDQTLPLMIRDWRDRWDDDFSFYFVQLANFREPSTQPGTPDAWALLQDRMRRILDTTPKTGMAIINDVGEAKDIHPKNKKDPGERLALWALAKDYGRDLVYSGPLYKSATVVNEAIRVSFDQAGAGLKSGDGQPLKRFEVAGADRVWHWADAKVEGSDVIVSSARVTSPVAVRYAWASNPEGANLVNSEGLPASVFRSDDWDDVEAQIDNTAARAVAKRRALAAEIKTLKARRESLDRKSDEFQKLTVKQRKLLNEFKSLSDVSK